MRIGSVDPGGRTGLVEIEFTSQGRASMIVSLAKEQGRLTMLNICGAELDQTQELYHRLRDFDVVIIEDYVIRLPVRTTKREALSPVRIGFGLELLLSMSKRFNGKVILQPATVLGVITDDRLRQWDLWLPGKENKDIRSALKHLLVYLRGVSSG